MNSTITWRQWLSSPRRSFKIQSMLRERRRAERAERAGHRPSADRSYTHGEAAIEAGAAIGESELVDRAARKIGDLAERHREQLQRAANNRRLAEEVGRDTYTAGERPGARRRRSVPVTAYSGWTTTSVAAERDIADARKRMSRRTEASHLHGYGRWLTALAYLLLFVDVLALFISLGRMFNIAWTDPAVVPVFICAVFALVGAGAMALLATLLGRHVWAWRMVGEDDEDVVPRSGLLLGYGTMLAVLSLLSGWSIWMRIHEEAVLGDVGLLGVVLGLLIGCAGAAAPWLIVLHEMNNGSIETRTIAGLGPIVRHVEERQRAHRHAAQRAHDLAETLREEAQRLFVQTVHACGRERLRAEEIILVARSLHQRSGLHADAPPVVHSWTEPMHALAARLGTDLRSLHFALGQMGTDVPAELVAPAPQPAVWPAPALPTQQVRSLPAGATRRTRPLSRRMR